MARLKSLKIRRIDLVDKGASFDAETGEGAHVVLFKRDDAEQIEKMIRQEGNKWCVYSEDGSKKLGEYATKAEAVERLRQIEGHKMSKADEDVEKIGRALSRKNLGAIRSAYAALKQLLLAGSDDEKDEEDDMAEDTKKADETKVEPKAEVVVETKPVEKAEDAETISKQAAELAELKKRVEKAEADKTALAKEVKDERDLRMTKEWVQKATAYTSLPIKADEFGPVLKRVSESVTAEDLAEIERVLKAADEAMKTAGLFNEKGRSGDTNETATELLNKKALAMVAEKKATNYTDAINKIQIEDPELARRYMSECS